jgi:hypothetical protein
MHAILTTALVDPKPGQHALSHEPCSFGDRDRGEVVRMSEYLKLGEPKLVDRPPLDEPHGAGHNPATSRVRSEQVCDLPTARIRWR